MIGLRAFKIYWIIYRYGLMRRVLDHSRFWFLAWLRFLFPARASHSIGENIAQAFEALGPVFVKFGQILSTRRDILPDEVALSLAKLQDQVSPFAAITARQLINQALGAPVQDLFAEFEDVPLASASIAQVHAARLKTGETVIVKVLRPNIHRIVAQDLALFLLSARLLETTFKAIRRLGLREVIAELERTLFDEMDLLKEAANASTLKRNFNHSSLLYIPKVYWHYTCNSVMVMERIYGLSINNREALEQAKINLTQAAYNGVKIFYTQIFKDGYFHADMHPGNLFINPNQPDNPAWFAVDFGMMGSLSRQDQHYLAANFLAFINRDYKRVAELHLESGWVPKDVRVDILEAAIRAVCEPIFEQPVTEISFGQTFLRLIQIARQFRMHIMPELLLLQKTLINIEGVARQLDPNIDLWQVARPILQDFLKKQMGWRGFIKKLKNEWPAMVEALPELPNLIYLSLKKWVGNNS